MESREESSIEARVQEARLVAMRQEVERRRHAPPEERREGRGVKMSFRGAMAVIVVALILGGLYALKRSSRELHLRDDVGEEPRRRW